MWRFVHSLSSAQGYYCLCRKLYYSPSKCVMHIVVNVAKGFWSVPHFHHLSNLYLGCCRPDTLDSVTNPGTLTILVSINGYILQQAHTGSTARKTASPTMQYDSVSERQFFQNRILSSMPIFGDRTRLSSIHRHCFSRTLHTLVMSIATNSGRSHKLHAFILRNTEHTRHTLCRDSKE